MILVISGPLDDCFHISFIPAKFEEFQLCVFIDLSVQEQIFFFSGGHLTMNRESVLTSFDSVSLHVPALHIQGTLMNRLCSRSSFSQDFSTGPAC